MKPNQIAALIHKDMCEDERNGYSWSPRFGGDHPDGSKTLTIDGKKYTYKLGSYDCSSSTITAWQLTLGITLNCSTTYDMKQAFLATGLFEWKPMSFNACPGDLYLNEENHVAMCQVNNGSTDTLSEFSINEKGSVYGGKVGDQTGWESHITDFYNYPWDGILHYKGGTPSSKTDTSAKTTAKKTNSKPPTEVKYRIYRDGKWRNWRKAGQSAGVEGQDIYDFEASGLGVDGWFQLTLEDGTVLGKNERNEKHAKRVIGITVYYHTPDPAKTGYWEAVYRVQVSTGAWLKWEHDDDDDGAGDDEHPIHRIQLKLEPVS